MPICRVQQATKFLIILWSLVVSASVLANNEKPDFSISPSPEWIQFKAVSLKPINTQQSSESYLAYEVFRDISQPLEVFTFRLATQINNTQGIEEQSQVSALFYPSYEKIHWHTIDVIRDGKVMSRLNRDDFNVFQQEDELDSKIYDEQWTIMSVLQDVRVGDIVSYSYSIIGQNPIFNEHKLGKVSQNFGVPMDYTNFIVRSQKDQPLYFKMHNFQADMVKTERDGLTYYQLERFEIPERSREDYVPDSDVVFQHIEYSSFKDWGEVNQWAKRLYDDKYQLDEALKTRAKQWKQTAKNSLDYISQAVRFVQKDIRYWGIETGVNSHLPSLPSETASRRYGDCKDKAVLLTALLRENGIESYPALVSGSNTSFVFKRLATPSAFDHVITTFFLEGKQYWIDGTIDSQSTALPNITHPDYKAALVIRDEESELSTMNPGVDTQYLNAVDVSHHYTIDAAKKEVALTITTKFSGGLADSMRRYTNSNTTQSVDNNNLQYFSNYYNDISIAKPSDIHDDLDNNIVTSTTYFTLKNVGEEKSARIEYSFYQPELREYSFLPNSRERQQAFSLLYPFDFKASMTVTTLDEQKPMWASEATYEEDNVEYVLSKKATSDDTSISQGMHYVHKADRVAPESFDRFKKNLEDTLNNAVVNVWLPKNTATQASTKKRVRSMMQNILKRNQ